MTGPFVIDPFELPLSQPLTTECGTLEVRRGFVIQYQQGGVIGVGEATPLPGWTESLPTCRRRLERAAVASSKGTSIDLSGWEETPAARHGIDLSRIDQRARRKGHPLAEQLAGGRPADVVKLHATIGRLALPDAIDRANQAVREGFQTVKCKVGRDETAVLERIRAIRDAVGEATELRVDANRGWEPAEATRILESLADLNVALVEEPLRDPTPARLDALPTTSPDIFLDETVSREAFSLKRWKASVDGIVLKPMAIGGIERAYDLGSRAHRQELGVIVSNTIDAVVARTAAIHLAAALPTERSAGLATREWLLRDLAPDPIDYGSGRAYLPSSPGLGTLGPWEASG